MLFEKLVEQHRVHCVVAHGVGLPFRIANHQIGIDLRHFLSHETKLRDAFGIDLLLITEGHRFERENSFARFVYGFDVVLETRRGSYLPVAHCVNHYMASSLPRCPTNASDKSAVVRALSADADFVGLARHSRVADIDVVTARGEILTGLKAQGDVAPAGCAIERLNTSGRVGAAGLCCNRAPDNRWPCC